MSHTKEILHANHQKRYVRSRGNIAETRPCQNPYPFL